MSLRRQGFPCFGCVPRAGSFGSSSLHFLRHRQTAFCSGCTVSAPASRDVGALPPRASLHWLLLVLLIPASLWLWQTTVTLPSPTCRGPGSSHACSHALGLTAELRGSGGGFASLRWGSGLMVGKCGPGPLWARPVHPEASLTGSPPVQAAVRGELNLQDNRLLIGRERQTTSLSGVFTHRSKAAMAFAWTVRRLQERPSGLGWPPSPSSPGHFGR